MFRVEVDCIVAAGEKIEDGVFAEKIVLGTIMGVEAWDSVTALSEARVDGAFREERDDEDFVDPVE